MQLQNSPVYSDAEWQALCTAHHAAVDAIPFGALQSKIDSISTAEIGHCCIAMLLDIMTMSHLHAFVKMLAEVGCIESRNSFDCFVSFTYRGTITDAE